MDYFEMYARYDATVCGGGLFPVCLDSRDRVFIGGISCFPAIFPEDRVGIVVKEVMDRPPVIEMVIRRARS